MGKKIMRTAVEKEAIVLEYMNTLISTRAIAEKYGTTQTVINGWLKKYRTQGKEGLVSKTGTTKGGRKGRKKYKNKTEVDSLNEKILKLEIENERLKKGYMVKGVGAKKEYVTTFEKNTK